MKNKVPIRYDSYHAVGEDIILYYRDIPVARFELEDAIHPFLSALEQLETIDYAGYEDES